MKDSTVLFFLLLLVFFVSMGFGDSFGIGVDVGQPSGLNFRYEMTYEVSLQGGIGYSFLWEPRGVDFNLDFVYFFRQLIPIGKGYLPLYVGGGFNHVMFLAAVEGETEKKLFNLTGFEFPIGFYYPIPLNSTTHLEVYGQVRPGLKIMGGSGFSIRFDIGVRYHF